MTNFIGIVFARSGSKGLKDKNILPFNGKPLIGWSIDQLKMCPYIDDVIVSTDSNIIADISLEYGAIVPFIRPPELAKDTSSEWLSWKHAALELIKLKYNFDFLVSAPTTSPLRITEDVTSGIEQILKDNSDALISVRKSRRHPAFNMVKITDDNHIKIYDNSESYTRRQDVNPVYDITTVLYIASKSHILKSDGLQNGNLSYIEIPYERSIDIDDQLDFDIANFIFNMRKNNDQK